MDKCPECGGTRTQERVELIVEPVEGKRITYGSRYSMCLGCKVSWYDKAQMAEQMANRGRKGPVLSTLLQNPHFKRMFFAGNLPPREDW